MFIVVQKSLSFHFASRMIYIKPQSHHFTPLLSPFQWLHHLQAKSKFLKGDPHSEIPINPFNPVFSHSLMTTSYKAGYLCMPGTHSLLLSPHLANSVQGAFLPGRLSQISRMGTLHIGWKQSPTRLRAPWKVSSALIIMSDIQQAF